MVNRYMSHDLLVCTSPCFHNNSDISVTVQTPFTDEGGCIVTDTSELLWKLWASAYQRFMKEPCPPSSTQQGPDAHGFEEVE